MVGNIDFRFIRTKIKKKLEIIVRFKIIRNSEFARVLSQLKELRNRELFRTLCVTEDKNNFLKKDMLDYIKDNLHLSNSQNLQDLIAGVIVGEDGYFVEFGAADGIEYSNSYYLEKYLGWNGILIEPDRYWKGDLKRNRKCKLDFRAVVPFNESGNKLKFNSNASPLHSKLVDQADEQMDTRRSNKVTGASLLEILTFHDAPKRIDLISMDVEGSEMAILESFDFKAFNVKFWIIEHNYRLSDMEKIKKLMFLNGYEICLENFSAQDFYFVNKNMR